MAQIDKLQWGDAAWAAAFMALDGVALGGVCLRGPSGPGRDAWLDLVRSLLPSKMPFRRCPARIDEERLLGGLDLSASLASGTSVLQKGLLSEVDVGVVVFAMAECLPTGVGAQIANAHDQGCVQIARDGVEATLPTRFAMILLDEGADEGERAPDALLERCGLRLSTLALPVSFTNDEKPSKAQIEAARVRLSNTTPYPDAVLEALCEAAFAFGIQSSRPVLYAVHAASLIAALKGPESPSLEDAAIAARLMLAPVAKRLPAPDEPAPNENEPSQEDCEGSEAETDQQTSTPNEQHETASYETADPSPTSSAPPADMLIEVVKAALPEGVIAALMAEGLRPTKARDRDGRGTGNAVQSAKRGRPLGSRRGSLRTEQRLHLIDTLRAAAPWQKLRQAQVGAKSGQRVYIRPDDIRIRRFIEKRETTIVFCVDASGSAAWQRLAEAKGAVQLMLAHAYQSRARVALVAFRKDGAEVILPPTRSLARARRLLADMVGGGGTPLANGLETALHLALSERKKGRTPRLLLLTDGQANIARDGSPGRPQAQADAVAIARQIKGFQINTVHIDTASRPRANASDLAAQMGAKYAPLPSPRSTDLAQIAGLSS